ncbi:MAG: hybrid sensor histidine kinase/response regulator [Myxococcota bacterium]
MVRLRPSVVFDALSARLDDLLALYVSREEVAPDHRRRIQVITLVTTLIVAIALPFIVQYWRLGIPSMSAAVTATVLAGLGNLAVLYRSRDTSLAGVIGTGVLFLLLLASNLHSGGFYDPNFGWFYTIPMLAALTVNARAGWAFTALVIVTTSAFWLAEQSGFVVPDLVPPESHAQQSLFNRVSAIIAIAVILAALASRERFSATLLRQANEDRLAEMRQSAEMQARLVHSERMASMGSLTAGMAHEMNNPLTWVKGNLQVLLRELRSTPRATQDALMPLVTDALDGAERMQRIVYDLRGYTRPREAHQVVDIRALLQRAKALTAAELKHRATVEVDAPDNLSGVVQEARLLQVLVNLLTNAAHAIEAGARNNNAVRMVAEERNDKVYIEIIDTGSGMTPATRDRAFEPLFTTKDVGQGTGLGLFICKNLIEGMDGQIGLYSELGRGTTVWLELPLAEVPFEPASSSVTSGVRGPRLRILVVDDEPAILAWLQAELTEHHLVATTDPSLGVATFLNDEVDVLLCDLMMPNLTGVDVHRILRMSAPERAHRVVFMTGGAYTPNANRFASRDGVTILRKPLDPAELRAALRDAAEVSPS